MGFVGPPSIIPEEVLGPRLPLDRTAQSSWSLRPLLPALSLALN